MTNPNLAQNDAASTDEDTPINVPVLANDHGGRAKHLYSLNQTESSVATTAKTTLGATVTMNTNGTVTYDPTQSPEIQALTSGRKMEDTFTYTMQVGHGATSTASVTVHLTGDEDVQAVFAANDGTHGQELWVTDGTDAGTQLVEDINPGPNGSTPINFFSLGNGQVLFQAEGSAGGIKPWITDGTAAGTHLLKDIDLGFAMPLGGFSAFGKGQALFNAREGATGVDPWITDGTAAGTRLVADIPGSGSHGRFTDLGNGRALFSANDGVHGDEPWVTDGTAAGTHLLLDINPVQNQPGIGFSSPVDFVAIGGGLALFRAYEPTHGAEPWITDATPEGTHLLKDINPQPHNPNSPGAGNSFALDFFAFGDGRAVFRADDGVTGSELWTTNGTADGTHLVKDINPGPGNSGPGDFCAIGNGQVLFRADDGVTGSELWTTNGTADGTHLVKDINPGPGSSGPGDFCAIGNGQVLFRADDGVTGAELWTTNGTADGTHLLKDINPGPGDFLAPGGGFLALSDGQVLFSADDGTHGRELWTTDDTAAGTQLVSDINPGPSGSFPSGFTPLPPSS